MLKLPLSKVSAHIGKPPAYLSNMIANENDPSGSTIVALAAALKSTPNDLLGIANRVSLTDDSFIEEQAGALVHAATERAREMLCEIGTPPSMKEVVGWALRNNGRLEDFDHLREFSTLYAAPQTPIDTPTSTHVGQKSLARHTLNASSSDQLNELLKMMPTEYLAKLTDDQHKLDSSRPKITVERIRIDVPGKGVKVDFEYLRAYIKLVDSKGAKLILNYSEPIFD